MEKGICVVMVVRDYVPTDKDAVASLFESWAIPSRAMDYASTTGYVLEDVEIHGAVFLYKTNSPVSMIDLFVIDPSMSKEKRDQGIDELLVTVIKDARQSGSKMLVAEPRFSRSFSRLERHGFKRLNMNSFSMEL